MSGSREAKRRTWCSMYTAKLKPHHHGVVGEVSLDVDEEPAGFDLDYGRPVIDLLSLGLGLNLGRHLDEQFDLVAETQRTGCSSG